MNPEPGSSEEHKHLLLCWAKTAPNGAFHPALYHMLDVGNVALALLDEHGPERPRKVLARALGADPEQLIHWLPYFVALHDIGKISATFQRQSPEQLPRLREAGMVFEDDFGAGCHHSLVGAAFIHSSWGSLEHSGNPALSILLRDVVGGHHGRFQPAGALLDALDCPEHPQWAHLRREACRTLRQCFRGQSPLPETLMPNLSAAIMALTGFTILSDWLGSDSVIFPPSESQALETYAHLSRQRAQAAVARIGFEGPDVTDGRNTFADLFPQIPIPRPLQLAIDQIPPELLAEPCLCLIEAPTGEGKTEAALALAHRLRSAASSEMYYALPTEATSNQMYGRVHEFFGLPVKLIHSHAFLMEQDMPVRPADDARESADNRQGVLEWFAPKKRALLAPHGVGTVDQAELAALNVAHGALRMFGLSGKVIVIDEVHAYDTYMTTIIERLLEWLSALGTPVIMLSATLPNRRREALLRAYAGEADPGSCAYPLISLSSSGRSSWNCSPAPSNPDRIVSLECKSYGSGDYLNKSEALISEIASGGCAAWICNTVARAQGLYRAVRQLTQELPVTLIHSRFPVTERERRERELDRLFGPPGKASRPPKSIVIGTQVLEQCLDLDFDIMFTDLAPIDLLLQRAGRLHRHHRPVRPIQHRNPRLIVAVAPGADGDPVSRPDTLVYDEFILRKSYAVLLACGPQIVLPRDTRPFIEAVYDGALPETADDILRRAFEQHLIRQEHARSEARLRLIAPPVADEPILGTTGFVFNEEEDGTRWIDARTRLGMESVTLIPLYEENEAYFLDSAGQAGLPHAPLTRGDQLELLRLSIRLSHRSVVRALRAQHAEIRPPWGEATLLRGCLPLILRSRQSRIVCDSRAYVLRLDSELGLVVESEGVRDD